MIRKVLLAVVALFVVIQFFRPERNVSTSASPNAIGLHYPVPNEITGILRSSCFDCHSNNTAYPWYSNIQPFASWLQGHIDEGKEELNFDEFKVYDVKKKKHKLDELVEMIEDDEMPLGSYTVIHREAVLSASDRGKIISWAQGLQKTIH